jgi:cyanophycin synthetase
VRLGPSTGSIVHAAVARGIPFRRLTEGSLVHVRLGQPPAPHPGRRNRRHRRHRRTIAQDKELTKKLLDAAGVPVPLGRVVSRSGRRLGRRPGSRPAGRDQAEGRQPGQGRDRQRHHQANSSTAGFHAAAEFRDDIMVERYLPGHDYRLLVIGNKLIAAARRDPPHVVGDGVHTVRQLVDQVNLDPRRGNGHSTSLTKIRFDDIALASWRSRAWTPNRCRRKGQRVTLRNNANLSTGGSATDVTDDVHPEVAARAIAAAHMVGLDICGVDLVCDSVLKPIEEQNGGIVEVNAAPGLRMHISPSFGKGRAVGEAIMDTLFGWRRRPHSRSSP